MENPRQVHESKAFRWVGHPSEEALLGVLPPAASRQRAVSFAPRSVVPPVPVATATAPSPDVLPVAPRWRLQPRDLIAVAAVGAAVWFALRGAEGLPFRSFEAVAPPSATELVAMNVAFDRQQLRSLPRGAGARVSPSGGARKRDDRGGSASTGDPKPRDPSKPPLLQATVPGVGTVTVNQPDLPETPVEAPTLPLPEVTSLPGTEDLLP